MAMCAVFINRASFTLPPRHRRRAAPGALLAALLVPALLLAATGATALPEDRLQAIEITAERAERNEREGYTVYSGDVILTQGSLRIHADRLTIFHDRVAADRIIAVGEPARLRQQPAIDKQPVRASARRIVYEKSRELVMLRESASIEQDGAVVTGESIQYFMAEERVRADATADDESSRVQVFIPADVIGAAQDGSATEGPEPAEDAPGTGEAAPEPPPGDVPDPGEAAPGPPTDDVPDPGGR